MLRIPFSHSHQRWLLILAATFAVYTLLLLGNTYRSQSLLRMAAEMNQLAQSRQAAEVLSDLMEDQRKFAVDLAKRQFIENYLINKSLGMSMRYGLNLSLYDIEEGFRSLLAVKTRMGKPIYIRMLYFDEHGAVLADTEQGTSVVSPSVVDGSIPQLRVDGKQGWIIATAPVLYRGTPGGLVMTVASLDSLQRYLPGASAGTGIRQLVISDAGEELTASGDRPLVLGDFAQTLAGIPADTLTRIKGLNGSISVRKFGYDLALRTPISGTALSIITLLPESAIYGHLTSRLFLFSASAVPLVILLLAGWIILTQRYARKLEADFAESNRNQVELQDRNEALAAEVARREEVEQALRESEKLLSSIFRAAPTGIGVVSNRILLIVNDRICDMTGYSREEIIGQSARILYPSDAHFENVGTEKYRQFLQYGTGTVETQWRCKDGRIFDILMSSAPLNPMNLAEGVTFTALDITERKKAEYELRESETKYRLIAENTADLISILDMKLKFTYVSPASKRIRGFTVEEAMAQTIDQVLTPESMKCAFSIFEEEMLLENSGKSDPDRTRIIELEEYKKDGSTVWLEVSLSFLRDQNLKPVEILIVSRDISERKRSEEALKESYALQSILIDNLPAGVIIVDPVTRVIERVNGHVAALFGAPVSHLLGHRCHSLLCPANEGACPVCDLGNTVDNSEREMLRKDGNRLNILKTVKRIHLNGQDKLLECFVDLSERKRADAERQSLQSQLLQAQKMESVGRLAGGVAHDFNNMLQSITGNAELALDKIDFAHPLYGNLSEILKVARRSADLTRQLLAFARKQTISPITLDLNETIAGMLKMLHRLIGENIDLAWKPSLNLWTVKVDPSQIDQILVNLCVNACDAIAGVGSVIIETKNVRLDQLFCGNHAGLIPGEYVLIAVSDTGEGIEKDMLDQIFEPFFTTKDQGKGTGLGLSTVYGIVKQNNGFIYVYSEPGMGSTFKIYLPRFVGEAKKTTGEGKAELPKGSGETVLIVEDEQIILDIGKEILEKLGYTVMGASTPGEALHQVKASDIEINLLITDVIMPEMNGRELANLIVDIKPKVKCLFISGYTANVIAHHGVLDPGVNFIQKPFSIKDLAVKVREVLDYANG